MIRRLCELEGRARNAARASLRERGLSPLRLLKKYGQDDYLYHTKKGGGSVWTRPMDGRVLVWTRETGCRLLQFNLG